MEPVAEVLSTPEPKTAFGQKLVEVGEWLESVSEKSVKVGERDVTHGDAWIASGAILTGVTALSTGLVPSEQIYSKDMPEFTQEAHIYRTYLDLALESGEFNGNLQHIPTFAKTVATQIEGSPLGDKARLEIIDNLLQYVRLKDTQRVVQTTAFLAGIGAMVLSRISEKSKEPLKFSTVVVPKIANGLTAIGKSL